MTYGLAIFTGLWYWLAQSKLGYTFHAVISQPIVMAFPIGLIMGDVVTAMIIGAAIEVVYLGMVAAGANIPADEALAGVIAIPIALQTGLDPAMAVTLAIPFGVLGVFIDQLRRIINVVFARIADKQAQEGNMRGIVWYSAFLYPMLLGLVLRFPPVFVANLFGAGVVERFINAVPEWLLHGLSVAGGLLPALGFAIVIFVIGRRNLIPFFIIGFFLVMYFEIDVMAAAIFGACIAFLAVFLKKETGEGTAS